MSNETEDLFQDVADELTLGSATAQDSSLLEPFCRVMVEDHAG